MTEFGGLIRDGRERLGLSANRVAELIGRASGTVKAWERGRTVPSDPMVVTSLAAVLAIDEERLFTAAGLTPPGVAPTPTIEQELASIAPPRRPDPEREAEPERERSAVITDEQPAVTPEPDQAPPEMEEPDAISQFLARAADGVRSLRFPSFERRRQTPQPESKVRAVPIRPAPTPPQTAGVARSYMEDGEERWAYRLRVIWTVAGLGGLGVALVWAGSRVLEAFGDALDALLAGL